MTTKDAATPGRSRAQQAVHLLLAALAAVVIAVASQGWPSPAVSCEAGSTCDGVQG